MAKQKEQKSVRSLEIINDTKLYILRLLTEPKSIYRVRTESGLRGYSTCHRHIQTLVQNGFVIRTSDTAWQRTKAGTKFLNAIDEGRKGAADAGKKR